MSTIEARDAQGRMHSISTNNTESVERHRAASTTTQRQPVSAIERLEQLQASAHPLQQFDNSDVIPADGDFETVLKAENLELKQYALQLEAQLHIMLVREEEQELKEAEVAHAHKQEVDEARRDLVLLRNQLMQLDPHGGKHDEDERSALEKLVKNVVEENNSLRKVLNNKQRVLAEVVALPPSERTNISIEDIEEKLKNKLSLHDFPRSGSLLTTALPVDASISDHLLQQQLKECQQAVHHLYKLVDDLHQNAQGILDDFDERDKWSKFWTRNQQLFDEVGLDLLPFKAVVSLAPIPDPVTERGTETDDIAFEPKVLPAQEVPNGSAQAEVVYEQLSRVSPQRAAEGSASPPAHIPPQSRTAKARSKAPVEKDNKTVFDRLKEVKQQRASAEREGKLLSLQLYSGGVVPERQYYKNFIRTSSLGFEHQRKKAFK